MSIGWIVSKVEGGGGGESEGFEAARVKRKGVTLSSG